MGLLALLHIAQAALGLCPGTAGGQGDPHLYGAHGGHADFRGRDNTFFNVVSHQKMSANVKTKDGEFRLHGTIVNGSWMVEFHLIAPTTAGPLFWTYDAARISPASLLGFSNGTCGGVPFIGAYSSSLVSSFGLPPVPVEINARRLHRFIMRFARTVAAPFSAVAPAGRVGAGDCRPVTEASPPRIFNSAAAAAASISSASIVMKASQQTLPPDAEIANKRSVVGSIA